VNFRKTKGKNKSKSFSLKELMNDSKKNVSAFFESSNTIYVLLFYLTATFRPLSGVEG